MSDTRRFTDRNEAFTCAHCGARVEASERSCRNHCPQCLYSIHLDLYPGDRAAHCGGLMAPVAVEYNPRKGYQIVHRCERCGEQRRNVASLDDRRQPDSLEALLQVMASAGE